MTVIQLIGKHTDSQLRFYCSPGYEKVIELETFVEPIGIKDHLGKEIVLEVDTKINNNKTFYTDSNGLEMQERIVNYRPTWQL